MSGFLQGASVLYKDNDGIPIVDEYDEANEDMFMDTTDVKNKLYTLMLEYYKEPMVDVFEKQQSIRNACTMSNIRNLKTSGTYDQFLQEVKKCIEERILIIYENFKSDYYNRINDNDDYNDLENELPIFSFYEISWNNFKGIEYIYMPVLHGSKNFLDSNGYPISDIKSIFLEIFTRLFTRIDISRPFFPIDSNCLIFSKSIQISCNILETYLNVENINEDNLNTMIVELKDNKKYDVELNKVNNFLKLYSNINKNLESDTLLDLILIHSLKKIEKKIFIDEKKLIIFEILKILKKRLNNLNSKYSNIEISFNRFKIFNLDLPNEYLNNVIKYRFDKWFKNLEDEKNELSVLNAFQFYLENSNKEYDITKLFVYSIFENEEENNLVFKNEDKLKDITKWFDNLTDLFDKLNYISERLNFNEIIDNFSNRFEIYYNKYFKKNILGHLSYYIDYQIKKFNYKKLKYINLMKFLIIKNHNNLIATNQFLKMYKNSLVKRYLNSEFNNKFKFNFEKELLICTIIKNSQLSLKNNLINLINDLKLSVEINDNFKKNFSNKDNEILILNNKLFNNEINKDIDKVKLPIEMVRKLREFKNFLKNQESIKSENNSNGKLLFNLNYDICLIEIEYLIIKTDEKITIKCNLIQGLIIMLFDNDVDKLSINEIMKKLNLNHDQVLKNLKKITSDKNSSILKQYSGNVYMINEDFKISDKIKESGNTLIIK